jgi:hypothetical protein
MRQSLLGRINEIRQRTGFQWGGGELIVAGILIIGILSLGSGMFGKWLRASRGEGLLMVDLHAISAADYGVDEKPVSVPAIGLAIIEDLLGLRRPFQNARPGGIALVTPVDPTPTPTLPFTGALPETSLPDVNNPTDEPGNTATPVTGNTATATVRVPTATAPHQQPGPTSQPTATSWSSPTHARQPAPRKPRFQLPPVRPNQARYRRPAHRSPARPPSPPPPLHRGQHVRRRRS